MTLWRYGVMALWRYGVNVVNSSAAAPLCHYAVAPSELFQQLNSFFDRRMCCKKRSKRKR